MDASGSTTRPPPRGELVVTWIMTALFVAMFAWANAPQSAWADLDRLKDAKEDINREKKDAKGDAKDAKEDVEREKKDAKGDAKREKKRAKRDLKH